MNADHHHEYYFKHLCLNISPEGSKPADLLLKAFPTSSLSSKADDM